MLTLGRPALDILICTIIIYPAIPLGPQLAGKREIGQANVFDLVVLLLLANMTVLEIYASISVVPNRTHMMQIREKE